MLRQLTDGVLRGPAATGSSAPDLDIGDCSVELIEGAWNITTLLLDRADAAATVRLVRVRQAYLDELARRDPATLSVWARQALTDQDTFPVSFDLTPAE
jgi:hypothetical protein